LYYNIKIEVCQELFQKKGKNYSQIICKRGAQGKTVRLIRQRRRGWRTSEGSAGELGVLRVLRVLFLRLGAQRNDPAKNLFFARILPVFPVLPVFSEPGKNGALAKDRLGNWEYEEY